MCRLFNSFTIIWTTHGYKKKAEAENGIVTAYASEEVRFASNQPWIFIKLKETKGLDGVIFFSVDQFLYGDHFNLKLFKNTQYSKQTNQLLK